MTRWHIHVYVVCTCLQMCVTMKEACTRKWGIGTSCNMGHKYFVYLEGIIILSFWGQILPFTEQIPFVMRSSQMILNSKKYKNLVTIFAFEKDLAEIESSGPTYTFSLLRATFCWKTSSKLNLWFHRSSHFSAAKNNIMQRKLNYYYWLS